MITCTTCGQLGGRHWTSCTKPALRRLWSSPAAPCAFCKPREKWKFVGRETHWGYDYLVYTLTANPSGRRKVGDRHAQVIW